ncbi:MAG: hypothetical protein HYV27_20060 [Candidatus Hydrogenedentes bacterium]|nr:hypothetical protein [Candidatus Hydrogenedentota bacterium]
MPEKIPHKPGEAATLSLGILAKRGAIHAIHKRFGHTAIKPGIIAVLLILSASALEAPHDVRLLRDTWGVPCLFGKADAGAAPPHCTDRAALFAANRLCPVLLTEAQVRKHLKREYRPGEVTCSWHKE